MNRNEFFQALPVARLNIRLTSAALEICTDDIDDVHVMASGDPADMEHLHIVLTANVLTVEQPVSKKPFRKTPSLNSWIQITIRLPRSWKGAIDARTVSGWMNIRGVSGTDLRMDTVSGQLMASDVSFLTISAHSVAGDIKLHEASSSKCTLISASGSLTAMRTAFTNGSASTATGLITLDLVAPFEELTVNSATGDICVDAPITECDAVLRSISGRIRTSGVSITAGKSRLRGSTVSSDLALTNNIESSFS